MRIQFYCSSCHGYNIILYIFLFLGKVLFSSFSMIFMNNYLSKLYVRNRKKLKTSLDMCSSIYICQEVFKSCFFFYLFFFFNIGRRQSTLHVRFVCRIQLSFPTGVSIHFLEPVCSLKNTRIIFAVLFRHFFSPL